VSSRLAGGDLLAGLTSTATTRPFMAARTLPSPPAAADSGAASVRSRIASETPRCRKYSRSSVAQEFCRLHHAVVAEADGIAVELLDLEACVSPLRLRSIAAVALAHDLDLSDLPPSSKRAASGKVAASERPAAPGRRSGMLT
jgi:hypothetical protein